jgi:LysM repeat protein
MSKKLLPLIVAVVLAGLLLSACQLRASRPPEPTPTTTADFPFPVGEGQQQDVIGDILTQTASVGGGAPEQVQDTPEPASEPQAAAPEGNDDQSGGGAPQVAEAVVNTPVPVAVPTVTRPTTHTIQKGEWPICIARRYDVSMSSLLSLNSLNMNSQVSIGTTLQIPQSGNWDPAHGSRSLKPHPTSYTVQSGDTVNSISCTFGDVTPEAIIAVNGLQVHIRLPPDRPSRSRKAAGSQRLQRSIPAGDLIPRRLIYKRVENEARNP